MGRRASSEGSGTTVLGPGGGVVEEDRTGTLGAGTSNSAAGAVNEDVEGMTAIATLTRSIIGERGVYAK